MSGGRCRRCRCGRDRGCGPNFNKKNQSTDKNEVSSTKISPTNKTGTVVPGNIWKYDSAMKKHKNKLGDVETKLIQALSAKQKCKSLLDQVRESRIAHRGGRCIVSYL